MENLANIQVSIGKEIEKIANLYKNEKPDRRNIAYLQEKLQQIETLWTRFEVNDDQIRALQSEPTSHAYFANDYYNKVKDGYEKLRKEITELIEYVGKKEQLGARQQLGLPQERQTSSSVQNPIVDNKSAGTTKTREANSKQDFEQVIRLIRRQNAIITQLENTLQTISFDNMNTKQYYQVKLDTIKRLWNQIEEINNTIFETTDNVSECGYNTEDYFELEDKVQEFVIKLSQASDNIQTNLINNSLSIASPTTLSHSFMKLPKIVLPRFDGDYLKWQQFYDLFSQMVHNQSMSNSQKMWYLKMNLVGEAEKLIRHLALTEENYLTAWNILKNRYENKRLLVTALLDKLITQSAILNESAGAIKTLHDTTKECVLSLQNLGLAVEDNWDPIIVHILMKKLDKNTHALYEQSLSAPRELQSIKNLLEFLEKRFQALEALGKGHVKPQSSNTGKQAALLANNGKIECMICKKNHAIYNCDKFLSLNHQERQMKAKDLNLCLNCLKKGHNYNKCASRGCLKCNKKHNTLLHFSDQKGGDKVNNNKTENEKSENNNLPATLTARGGGIQGGYVFLGTALAEALDHEGNPITCRVLLDSGSQLNFISEKFRRKLKLENTHVDMQITGIGNSRVSLKDRLNITMKSKINSYSTQLEVYVIKEIAAHQPQQHISIDDWKLPSNVILADPDFNKPQRVDILLGAELYGELIRNGQIRLDKGRPTLQKTVLGWIVFGRLSTNEYSKPFAGITNVELDNQLQRFWEIEDCPAKKIMSATDQKCEEYFESTTSRDADGRFVVSLPMLNDAQLLGNSREIAFKRFLSIERRLAREPDLKAQYCEFMDEYEKLGHMQEVKTRELKWPYYFLPHHCVLKPSSSTTKLRVVFDASAKTTTNLSLNDLLLTGPKIQDDLLSIILRFRTKKYVFSADIMKMYRQILIAEEDRNLQLIMWRKNPTDQIKYYQLCTVTYGTKPAPYLAVKCLQKLADDENINYPMGAAAIKDFYVDDVMTGSNDLEEAIMMQSQLQQLLAQAGFKLHKWCANHPRLVQNIPNKNLEIQLDFAQLNNEHVKTLGLIWHPITDHFAVTSAIKCYQNITKRTVLAEMSQIFDPLGLVNPVVVMSKLFIQKLWKLKLDWDDNLPIDLHTSWLQFRSELSKLNDMKVPRYVLNNESVRSIEIHAFADASERAYGTAVYIRSKGNNGDVTVRLLCAKSRIAPVKPMTLPRLELCAAKLATQVVDYVKQAIKLTPSETYYWTDSQIVLSWIRGDPSTLKTFVANRIASIQESTQKKEWRYVNTKDNPADLVSRGAFPEQLMSSKLWFEGPEFLKSSKSNWPITLHENIQLNEEQRTIKNTLISTIKPESDHPLYAINHRNSFRFLQRVMAYILRACKRFREKRHDQMNKHLSVRELEQASKEIFKTVQGSHFYEDIKQLKKTNAVAKSSPLTSLTPFIDEQGLIRVGGRLQMAEIEYATKHPILLPADNFVTKLLMIHIHITSLHPGPQALHALSRQKYWILQGRTIARSVVNNCVTCARIRPKLCNQQMGNLPAHRVQMARPFINCGVDFCGPFLTHFKLRGKKPEKTYIAVFCCMATKAIHLEVVSDLTTEGFLGALKRFIARRGRCQNIYCDNAKNFIGAQNQLEEIQHILTNEYSATKIVNLCNDKGIQFHFSPPRSPHFGGLWEAAVKSMKYLLRRSVMSASLTYEELCTVTAEIEAILNSRPLIPISTDPNDLTALTPAHFLIGEPMTATVNTHTEAKMSLLSRWALVSYIRNEFWKRWSQEYLIELQKRTKWTEDYPNIKPGTLVIIKEENMPPLKWSMGRIDEVIKGRDGKVRVVDVKTATGIFRRSIHQLAPLPIDLGQQDADEDPTSSNKIEEEKVDTEPKTTRESRKRKSPTTNISPLKVLLYTMLVLPLMTHATSTPPVETQEFGHNIGVYFEEIGKASIAVNDWHLLVYYNLTGYQTTIKTLETSVKHLKRISGSISQNTYYVEITSQYQQQIEEIKGIDETFLRVHNKADTRIRRKRSPFDIVGNIANKLFGVLDNDYAEKMTETIHKVKTNEDHLYDLIRNQTLIVETTVNIVKKTEEERTNQMKEVENSLEVVYEKMRNMNTEAKQQKLIQTFNTLAIVTGILINECHAMQRAVIDVITDTHHGKPNPLIISPEQLRTQLVIIKENIPAETTIPTTNQQPDILLIYRLMQTHYRIIDRYIIFGIKIPIVLAVKFNVYKITPFPVLVNDTMASISTESDYLMTNIYRDQFYLMKEVEFQQCNQGAEHKYVCKQQRPIQYSTLKDQSCEIGLFLQKELLPSCAVRITSVTTTWTQLSTPNQWLFSLDRSYDTTFICNNKVIQKTIKGNGLLKLHGDCTMKSEKLIIKSTNSIKTNVTTGSFQPKLNLSFEHQYVIDDQIAPLSTHVKLTNHTREFEKLTKEIHHIQAHQTSLQELQPNDIHQFTISYIGLAAIITIIIYWITKRCRDQREHRFVPTPAPRQSVKTPQQDYSFEV